MKYLILIIIFLGFVITPAFAQEVNPSLIIENMQIPASVIQAIQQLYKSDVRSMINCLQSKHVSAIQPLELPKEYETEANLASPASMPVAKKRSTRSFHIIDDSLWEVLYQMPTLDRTSSIAVRFQCDMKSLWKRFGNFIIRNKPEMISIDFLSFLETLMHMEHCQSPMYARYAITMFVQLRSKVA